MFVIINCSFMYVYGIVYSCSHAAVVICLTSFSTVKVWSVSAALELISSTDSLCITTLKV